jgi:hypothetical protein
LQGSPAVSIHGTTVALADTPNHRVLIWRDTRVSSANQMPDVVLGQSNSDMSSIHGGTLIEPISVTFDGKRLFVGDAALRRVLIWNSLPKMNNQPADAVLGQQNLTSIESSEAPAADSIQRPTALISDGINLFVADSVDRRVLVFSAADTPLPKNAILNSASLVAGPLAPGTLITIAAHPLLTTPPSRFPRNSQMSRCFSTAPHSRFYLFRRHRSVRKFLTRWRMHRVPAFV